MTKKPKRVQINNKWYDVGDGWAGSLELSTWMCTPAEMLKAKEPFIHMNNFWHVFDSQGNKVGEFDMDNRTYSGCITAIEW